VPIPQKPAHCEFCREAIIWAEWMPNPRARTNRGPQLVPLDFEPAERGRIALTERKGDRPLAGEMSRNQAAGYRNSTGKPLYVQHAKTCVKADELRRKIVARHARR
jgi:hypothetical protein